MRIDLNADIGESVDIHDAGENERLLPFITSGSIACGVHAGNPSVMRRTVRMAARAGVAIGAHPGFADRAGFGRREIEASPDEIADLVCYQVGALAAIAQAEGSQLQHVKPHGALYNLGARRRDVADAIAAAIASVDDSLVLVGLPGSALLSAGERRGLRVAAEGFADRSYEPDGTLTPRHTAGSVISDPSLAAERAIRMVLEGTIVARDGSSLPVRVDTICIHGDTSQAAQVAAAVRFGLEGAGVRIARLSP